jgi:Bacterial membrane protein YfhO
VTPRRGAVPDRPHAAGRIVVQEMAAIAIIASLVVIAFANVVFGGKSLTISTNGNPLDYRFLPQNYGPRFVPPGDWSRRNLVTFPNYRDPAAAALQMEPAAELLHRSLARGQFPFWDPFTGGGTPLFASLVPAYLFPPALLVAVLGNGTALRDGYLLLLIAGSGVLTYRLLRGRGLSWEAALAGGTAFAFSGAVIQTAPLGLGQPVAFFSLPLLATARLCERPSRRRAAEFAAAAAFVALASFPPVLTQIFGTCVAYLLAAVALGPATHRTAAVGWFSAGVAVALAIVSIAYVPALFAFSESPQVAGYYATAAGGTLGRWHAFQLLSPTINGGARVYANPPLAAPDQHLFYTGVVPLFLGMAGMLAPADARARPLKIAVMVAGGLAMAKVFGWPIVQWVAHVPLLRTVHYSSYFGILGAYAICVLAAFGVDAIGTARARYGTLAIAGTAIAATLTVLRLYAAAQHVDLHPEGWRWIADFRLLVLFAVLAAAGAFLAVHRPRVRVFGLAALLVVLGIEGVTNASFPRQRRWNVWEHPPKYIQVITEQGTGGRVQPMPLYPANTESVFGHSTLDSLTLVTSPRIFELYKRYFYGGIGHFLQQTNRFPPERVLDAANIEYFPLITSQTLLLDEARQRGYSVAFEDEFVRLMRRPTRPRYFFTSDYRVIAAPFSLEALPAIPAGTLVLDRRPSFEPVPGAPVPVRIVRFDLNAVEIGVEAPRAGLLYCSEARMSGWTATVDGRDARILAADYAFRAVEVPQGAHTVRFRYRSPGLLIGLALSAVGLAALLSGLLRPER